jgi:hypothetical protein
LLYSEFIDGSLKIILIQPFGQQSSPLFSQKRE